MRWIGLALAVAAPLAVPAVSRSTRVYSRKPIDPAIPSGGGRPKVLAVGATEPDWSR